MLSLQTSSHRSPDKHYLHRKQLDFISSSTIDSLSEKLKFASLLHFITPTIFYVIVYKMLLKLLQYESVVIFYYKEIVCLNFQVRILRHFKFHGKNFITVSVYLWQTMTGLIIICTDFQKFTEFGRHRQLLKEEQNFCTFRM